MNQLNPNFEYKQKLAMANDSSTSLLTELSKDTNREIRQLVTNNPNTPIEILEKLGEEFPEIVVDNPIFNLLLIENPDSRFVQLSLARSSTTSTVVLANLIENSDDPEIRNTAIANCNTTLEILEKSIDNFKYLRDRTFDSREKEFFYAAISDNPNASSEILDKIFADTNSEYWGFGRIHRQIARHPNTSASREHPTF